MKVIDSGAVLSVRWKNVYQNGLAAVEQCFKTRRLILTSRQTLLFLSLLTALCPFRWIFIWFYSTPIPVTVTLRDCDGFSVLPWQNDLLYITQEKDISYFQSHALKYEALEMIFFFFALIFNSSPWLANRNVTKAEMCGCCWLGPVDATKFNRLNAFFCFYLKVGSSLKLRGNTGRITQKHCSHQLCISDH